MDYNRWTSGQGDLCGNSAHVILRNILDTLEPEDAALANAFFDYGNPAPVTVKERDPKGVSAGAPAQDCDLHSNVSKLAEIESSRILVARKINRLGLDSALHLTSYFSRFGTVEQVLVNHSIDKSCVGGRKPRV